MRKRKIVLASLLAGVFVFQQSMMLSVIASNISGVTGNNGVYNIDPAFANGATGFRQYEHFNLTEGDIANLIMHKNGADLNAFVNLVDNKVQINGLLNTVDKNGAFAAGKAIFVSPNGVVVGNQGIVNVGSFEAYVPAAGNYNTLKNIYSAAEAGQYAMTTDDIKNATHYTNGVFINGEAPITIDGKVISRGDVILKGNGINVGANGGIVANVAQNETSINKDALNTLFNKLVNTDGITNSETKSFETTADGKLVIYSGGGITIDGKVVNYAAGANSETNIHNTLGSYDSTTGKYTNTSGLTVNGNVIATKGKLTLNNNSEELTIGQNAKVNNGGGNTLITTLGNMTNTLQSTGVYDNGKNDNAKLNIAGSVNTVGETKIINYGAKGLNVTGEINHSNGNLLVQNGYEPTHEKFNDTAGMNIAGKVNVTNGTADFVNYESGVNGMTIAENVNVSGKATYKNYGRDGLTVNAGKTAKSGAGLEMYNNGTGGMNINGTVENTGVAEITNDGGALNVTGLVTNENGNLTMTNNATAAGGFNVKNNGQIKQTGTAGEVKLYNYGQNGFNFEDSGNVNSSVNTLVHNEGKNGIKVAKGANVTSTKNTTVYNNATGGIDVDGHVNGNNVFVTSYNGDVVIGHDDTNNNIKAVNNVKITTNKASILNYADDGRAAKTHAKEGAKTLIAAGNDLTMEATDGTIGTAVNTGTCLGGICTGISDKTGTRDFNKSINANVGGNVTAKTTSTATNKPNKPDDLVINYAAIDSDMNIDNIDADGRVILTVDYGTDGTTRYNMLNAGNGSKANVEGYGLSLISSGNIGAADKKLTFNQTKAGTLRTSANDGLIAGANANATDGYGMDVLANGNIYMKADSDDYTVNNVCSMVSREGSIDVEFAGNTYIDEITAKKDVKAVTRGKTIEINHLGTVPSLGDNGQNGNDVYKSYLGNADRFDDNGPLGDDDGLGYDHATPNNAEIKALDINKKIRPDGQMVPDDRPTGTTDNYYAYADSTAVVRNGHVEVEGPNANGKIDVTADNVYVNGIVAHFKDDGFTKDKDPRTNPTIGGNTPTGHAVRPDDVADTGRPITDRNYYYPDGDGDIPSGHEPIEFKPVVPNPPGVDPDDGIVDATPMIIPIKPHQPTPPAPNPPQNINMDDEDGRITWKKQDDNNVQAIDKRQYMRFNVSDNKNPVAMERTDNGVDSLIDISRGGIAVKHSNTLKPGDIIPVHLTYGDLDIKTDVKVVSATDSRAGAEFINLDKSTANKLLYLNILLEDRNHISMY